tara:strand:- start:983 stop:1153 length:171 start_codon:yes stop_codon:yes gene_type:complete
MSRKYTIHWDVEQITKILQKGYTGSFSSEEEAEHTIDKVVDSIAHDTIFNYKVTKE